MTSLRQRYTAESGRVHLTGIQALARLTMDLRRADQRAGRRTAAFVSGYEGSPLGGFDLELQRNQKLLDGLDILLQPGLNEELAATAVQGTQLACLQPDKRVDGVIGLWYGKSPGVDRSADALRHNNLMGTHPDGGVLLLAGDDPTAKSSTVPGASENILADVGMPVLYPADPQDVLDLGRHGLAMSRACGLWVALKIVTNVADGSGSVDLDPARLTTRRAGPHRRGAALPAYPDGARAAAQRRRAGAQPRRGATHARTAVCRGQRPQPDHPPRRARPDRHRRPRGHLPHRAPGAAHHGPGRGGPGAAGRPAAAPADALAAGARDRP